MPEPNLEQLQRLLSQNDSVHSHWHIEYDEFLTNHITHGTIALYFLLDDAVNDPESTLPNRFSREDFVQAFCDSYKARHRLFHFEDDAGIEQRIPPVAADDDAHGRANNTQVVARLLGQKKHFLWLISRFEAELLDNVSSCASGDTPEAMLVRKWLPTLAPGLSGAALHGIIHLGLGVRAKSRSMIIEGLAYLAFANRMLPARPSLSSVCGSRKSLNTCAFARLDRNDSSDVATFAGSLLRGLKSAYDHAKIFDCVVATTTRMTSHALKSLKEQHGDFQGSMLLLSENAEAMELAEHFCEMVLRRFIPSLSSPGTSRQIEGNLPDCQMLSQALFTFALTAFSSVRRCDFFMLHGVTGPKNCSRVVRSEKRCCLSCLVHSVLKLHFDSKSYLCV